MAQTTQTMSERAAQDRAAAAEREAAAEEREAAAKTAAAEKDEAEPEKKPVRKGDALHEWIRREIHLALSGVTEDERREANKE